MKTIRPQKKCDLVMKGGVTSGVVYPNSVQLVSSFYLNQIDYLDRVVVHYVRPYTPPEVAVAPPYLAREKSLRTEYSCRSYRTN